MRRLPPRSRTEVHFHLLPGLARFLFGGLSLSFQRRATLISRNQVLIPPRLQPPPSLPPPPHSRRCHDQRISHTIPPWLHVPRIHRECQKFQPSWRCHSNASTWQRLLSALIIVIVVARRRLFWLSNDAFAKRRSHVREWLHAYLRTRVHRTSYRVASPWWPLLFLSCG